MTVYELIKQLAVFDADTQVLFRLGSVTADDCTFKSSWLYKELGDDNPINQLQIIIK